MNTLPKVLVIDDEEDILMVLSFLLKREGYQVLTASTGKEGLSLIDSHTLSAVVCDFSMPEMNGLQVLKEVRAGKNFVPFVFLSGHSGEEEEHEVVNYGAYRLVQKPHLEELIEVLKSLPEAHKEVLELVESGETGKEFVEILHSTHKKAI